MYTLTIQKFNDSTDNYDDPQTSEHSNADNAWQEVLDNFPTLEDDSHGYVRALRDFGVVAYGVELDYKRAGAHHWFTASVDRSE